MRIGIGRCLVVPARTGTAIWKANAVPEAASRFIRFLKNGRLAEVAAIVHQHANPAIARDGTEQAVVAWLDALAAGSELPANGRVLHQALLAAALSFIPSFTSDPVEAHGILTAFLDLGKLVDDSPFLHPHQPEVYEPPYGDLVALNTERTLLDAIGHEMLAQVASDYVDLLGSSAAIYEKNGDYALGIFNSGWCQYMDASSRKLCGTDDNQAALASGKWHCHESCWQSAKEAMRTGKPVDIACNGGIRLYAAPIFDGEEAIGAANFGYTDPPTDHATLAKLAEKFQVPVAELEARAESYRSRPPALVEAAKAQLETAARLMGEIASRKRIEQELRASEEQLRANAKELLSQQEELQALYDQLQAHSERVEAEVVARTSELRQQQEFTTRIIENAPIGIAYVDRSLVHRLVNPAMASFLQKEVSDIAGHHVSEVIPGGEDQVVPLLKRVLEGTPFRATAFPLTYRLPDGSPRDTWWDLAYVPSPSADGSEIEGVLIFATEVSDRIERERSEKQLHEERETYQQERIKTLEQADRMKDQFLGILSHELRTPINAVMGFGSVLDDEVAGSLNDEQRRYTQKILTSADSLLALIDDLLVMSRVQAGKFSVEPRQVDFGDLAAKTLQSLASEADKKRLHIRLDVPGAIPTMIADPLRLGQVLTNLVGNAIKFTPEDGTITVRAWVNGDKLRCHVSDSGPGIASADQPKLFQRFGQLDTSNTREHKGTGLGLSIVKAIVEAHGGQVGVESSLGAGSIFWFELPLEAVAPLAGQHQEMSEE